MEHAITAIEISSTSIKIVTGYVCEQYVFVLHSAKKDLPTNIIVGGDIFDPDFVCASIKELIQSAENALKIDIIEVTLVLPSLGLEVFENSSKTMVVAMNHAISEIDLRNVVSMLASDHYSDENDVIDVLPIRYSLDQNRTFSNPPLNEISNTLELFGHIHTVPHRIKEAFKGLVEKVGVKVNNLTSSAYAIGQLFTSYKNIPDRYILVDFGGRMTSINFIKDGRPYYSTYLGVGSENITFAIKEKMGVSMENASIIKHKFGLDKHEGAFMPKIVVSDENQGVGYDVKDLRSIIEAELENLIKRLNNALKDYYGNNSEYQQWSFVFIGGGSQMMGFNEFVTSKFPNRGVLFQSITSLGARSNEFLPCLGGIKVSSRLTKKEEHLVSESKQILTREKRKPEKYSDVDDRL